MRAVQKHKTAMIRGRNEMGAEYESVSEMMVETALARSRPAVTLHLLGNSNDIQQPRQNKLQTAETDRTCC